MGSRKGRVVSRLGCNSRFGVAVQKGLVSTDLMLVSCGYTGLFLLPDFRRGVEVGPIELVDEYQVFCHVLRVPAQPHNGTWARVRQMLAGEPLWPAGHENQEQDLEPTAVRSTMGPPLAAAPPPQGTQGPQGGREPHQELKKSASSPVRIALSVILGVIGWYIFLCVITNS